MRRAVAACAVVAVATIAGAAPAGAHTLSGVSATNYRSEILAVTPADPDVSVRLLDLGRRVELANRGASDVVVLGYDGEPSLRVGPRGTFENRRSPSLYQNRTTANGSQAEVPRTADANAAPQWRKVSGGHTVRWRDHRTRWEGKDPAAVEAAPDQSRVVVPAWTIRLQRGGAQATVTGRIVYAPPPSLLPWVVLTVVLFVVTAGAGALRWWGPLLSAGVAFLVAVDIVQSFASGGVSGDSLPVLIVKVLLGGVFSTVAWIVGAVAVGPLQRGKEGALVGAGVAGLFIALFSGLSDLATLASSQVPSTLPAAAARAGVAIALGVGVGLVAGVFVVIKTNPDVQLVPPGPSA